MPGITSDNVPLIEDSAALVADWARAPQCLQHPLRSSPLFSRAALERLIESHPLDSCARVLTSSPKVQVLCHADLTHQAEIDAAATGLDPEPGQVIDIAPFYR